MEANAQEDGLDVGEVDDGAGRHEEGSTRDEEVRDGGRRRGHRRLHVLALCETVVQEAQPPNAVNTDRDNVSQVQVSSLYPVVKST